jgi:hypothetical protein
MGELSLKQKIAILDKGVEVLQDMINDTDARLPKDGKHIIDRLNGIASDNKDIVECLRQKCVLDEEVEAYFGH